MSALNYVNLPALAFYQGEGRKLFTFAVEGKKLREFATISRISRQDDKKLLGYQRPEVASHIANITKYLKSENPMLPNSIVVAFDDVVDFISLTSDNGTSVQAGILKIPVPLDGEALKKPAWIVDGQQRTAALSEARLDNFYINVVGFIAKNHNEQREQFMLVNSTKPLAKGLLYELLPHTNCLLPSAFEKRRFPTYLLEKLNLESGSPFYEKIKTATNPDGIIQDNSILKMLENSLADGALYYIQENNSSSKQEEETVEIMLQTLNNFWIAASQVFAKAWNLPPKKSRLTHGAGIISLGFIMDAIVDRLSSKEAPSVVMFKEDLEKISSCCRWTYGYWEFGPGAQRKWNEVQNTPTDIRILSHYLLLQYKSLVWNEAIRYS
ncbi:DGQHR domain-containing protein DpdB [Pontibacter rugosus]|uniref:DGQHR domain-containing protein DpdB n=1 Tax=Pontibacter rugosus TaxID=1745966 RepID=A0ABW3ST37_9BACT